MFAYMIKRNGIIAYLHILIYLHLTSVCKCNIAVLVGGKYMYWYVNKSKLNW